MLDTFIMNTLYDRFTPVFSQEYGIESDKGRDWVPE